MDNTEQYPITDPGGGPFVTVGGPKAKKKKKRHRESAGPSGMTPEEKMPKPTSGLGQEMNESGSCTLTDDEELLDLPEEEESKIGDQFAELTVVDPINPPKVKPSFASAANKAPQGYEVLYIHPGRQERAPLPRELFYKLWDKLQEQTIQLLLQGGTPSTNVLWHSWSQNRGLVAVGDAETSKNICQMIGQISIKKTNFRAWHRGEFGEGRLVTTFMAGNGHKFCDGEKLMKLLKAQNRLTGKHLGAKTTDTDKGGKLIFFADPELWKDLSSRASKLAKHKVVLRLGLTQFIFWLSRKATNENNQTTSSTALADASASKEGGEYAGPGEEAGEGVTSEEATEAGQNEGCLSRTQNHSDQ